MSTKPSPELPSEAARRKIRTIAEIDPEVLAALERGEMNTVTLVEWLAIDQVTLAANVVDQIGLGDAREDVIACAEEVRDLGVTKRLRAIGAAFKEAVLHDDQMFERLASHPSDMARAWAAYALDADHTISLPVRLGRMRRFAADDSMATRECAWDSWREHVALDLNRGIELLEVWVRDPDERIRRCAVEGTRPRGVWTTHIPALKEQPSRGLPLLEPLKSDPSRYVQDAVANWLNDASKSRPQWVAALAERWLSESKTDETAYIVRRATRTLRKREQATEAATP